MDERHWWIATKIQETFQVDETDSPTALEQFVLDPNHLEIVTNFFAAGGSNKLFVYGSKPDTRPWMLEDLHMVTTLINLQQYFGMSSLVCVFFLRQSVDNPVDPIHMQRDVFCGEIKTNPLHQLSTVLSQVFFPMLKSQREWGKCSSEQKNQFLHNVGKYVSVLANATNKSNANKQQILRLPENLVTSDFKQHRISSQYDTAVIREYESVVQDWIQAIDGVLSEGSDERLLDVHSGPLTEVERWHRRQRVLGGIMEQLKSKECKNVIGVLIQTKSKLLKKWKAMDLCITDAQNETKDKVKYLETLRRHLEQLQHENNPVIVVNVVLPALVATIRQMESISRFYARSGYLGLLCKKICNQLASLCHEYISEVVKPGHIDKLWQVIEEEIAKQESTPPVFKVMKRGIRKKELVYDDDRSLVGRLKACLSLHVFYRDIVRSMKDNLGATGGGTHSLAQSHSSLDTLPNRAKIIRGGGVKFKAQYTGFAGPSSVVSGSDGKDYGSFSYGIPISDEESIMGHLDSLSGRIRQLLDIIAALRQFSMLAKDTAGLPRPRLEDIPSDGDDKSSSAPLSPQGGYNSQAARSAEVSASGGEVAAAATKTIGFPLYRTQQSMGTVLEEEEEDEGIVNDGQEESDIAADDSHSIPGAYGNEKKFRLNGGAGISDVDSDLDVDETRSIELHTMSSPESLPYVQYNAAAYLRRLYSIEASQGEVGPGLSSVILDHVTAMIKSMSSRMTTSMFLDVQGKQNDKFEESFNQFSYLSQNLDQLLSVYLAAIFTKSMKTQQGLTILSKFKAVSQRASMRDVIAERYSDVYATYAQELNRIQEMYEENKDNPVVPRDTPPAAGAIYWSRQLMSHIEEPMKIFQENKTLNQSKEYHRTVKFYNRVATALVTYETLWYQQWCKSVDHALTGLKVSLFVPDPTTGELSVNVDQKLLHLMHETKWMLRLKLEIPEAAKTVISRESQFKKYKMHLEQCLYDYKKVCSNIPEPFIQLFRPHTDSVLRCLQAGLNIITWDSMNIDAFLHKIRSATTRLRRIVARVSEIVDGRIQKAIDEINNTVLFDRSAILDKTWTTAELLREMQESIQNRSTYLRDHAQIVESSINEIIDVLSTSRINSAEHLHGLNAANVSKTVNPPPGRKPGPTVQFRRGTRIGSGSTATGVTSNSSSLIQAQLRFIPDQATVQDILGYYSRQMYSCVHKAVCNTLSCLCDSLGARRDDSSLTTDQRIALLPVSRPGSSNTGETRSNSPLSLSSNVSWSHIIENLSVESDANVNLKIQVEIRFRIPDIVVDPPLSQVQQAIDEIVESLTSAPRGITWWAGVNKNDTFEHQIMMDENVSSYRAALSGLTRDLKIRVRSYITHLGQYNFLWKDDMHRSYANFMTTYPDISAIRKEVENLLEIEKKISSIPQVLPAGCVMLCPIPIMDALQGLAAAWKTQYALVLHEDAKKKLDTVVQYRNNVQNRLSAEVITLDQLNSTLSLIDEIHDMENKIDDVYLPIENMYNKLKEYDLRLARSELQQVESLRQNWAELVQLADRLGHTLLKERRASFEQELDKQLKTFVVEVIQFRNAFDAQGPAVQGVRPAEAVQRLQDFQNRFTLYDAKRKTLDSVQRLFGILPKPFPELDKTGEELKLLGMLYGLFQKFIAFDRRFRDTLWENAGLHSANTEVQGYWEECLNLPAKLKEWDAYTEMKNCMKIYLDVFPLLHRLAKKGKFKDIMIPEIRNRHWLQVMSVTFSKFQLESNLFKMGHLLDIGLIEHKKEIQQICVAASKELELEVKMRGVEEEWTEQVLSFENYKRRGPVLLIKEDSERLLEQLEDAQALLANMLTSKHIGPLREEAASWAEKLKGVSEVLDTWLETQDLWQELEAVFSDHATAKELPQEAKRFSMVDKSYVKLMRRAYDTRNILQCCYGGEVPKGVVLRHMQEELEICFKSLTQYLDKKRAVFPRFYFLTDSVLLAVLSRPNDLESVRAYLRSIFSSIFDIKTEKSSSWSDTVSSMRSLRNTPTPSSSPLHQNSAVLLHQDSFRRNPPTEDAHHAKISAVRFKSGMKSSDSPHFSASYAEEFGDVLHATAVLASDGEILQLEEQVSLYEGAELWFQNLRDSVCRTLHFNITRSVKEIEANAPIEELALRYPAQVGRLALLYLWTRECESGIAELKWERKAMQNASKKFTNIISRLPAMMNRTSWKNFEDSVLPIHRARLENLIYYSVHLRDLLDGMGSRKMRELSDFEWRRSIRFYSQDIEGLGEHSIHILDNQFSYGMEFYGVSSSANLALIPATEKAFVSMAIALSQYQGSSIVGSANSGKTQTIMGLANLLGKFIFMIRCTDTTDSVSVGKILQGLATDGCWGCFDDIHLLPSAGVSVLLDFTQSLMGALKKMTSKKAQAFVSCIGTEGQSITVDSGAAMFITYNSTFPHAKPLPTAIRSLYRNVSIVKPDLTALLKAKCTALGLRSPKSLADRLRCLAYLSYQQIPRPAGQHHEVSLQALVASLVFAALKRKARDERVDAMSRSDTVVGSRSETDQKLSRSNSQTSVRVPMISPSPTVVAPSRPQAAISDKLMSKKVNVPNTLNTQAKIDHGLVAQAIMETISPGLNPADTAVFHSILRDVFSGIPMVKELFASGSSFSTPTTNGAPFVPSSHSLVTTTKLNQNLEAAINQVATERGLVPQANWITKASQLWQMAEARQGVVLAGPAGSGKSTLLSVLVDALCSLPSNQGTGRAMSPGMSSHKLQKLNPLTVDDLSLMFGHVGHSREWVDGILTYAWRKANRNQSTTWLCLDGSLVSSWADRFNSALSDDRVMQLSNGDRLYLTENMRIVFETTDLENASPSLLARTGLVYVDKNVLGWRPLAKAWLETRNSDEKRVLQKAFDKTLDSACGFVFHDNRIKIPVCEVGLLSTCLTLLGEMLNDHQQHIGGDLHIERLFLFCLVWAFGGLLEGHIQKAFSDLLRTLSSALPDYDHEISVFDYYVDESGEWDTWMARVPEATYTGTTDMLGEVFVDTVDTIRTRSLLDFAHMARKHTLVVGESGIGKTALINDFLDTQDKQFSVLRRLVFSRASTATQLHSFMQHNIQHRQGFVYGAKDGKYLETFIDDLNLPARDADGIQRCNELLRTLIDGQMICKLSKPFEWRTIEGLEVLATMSTNPTSPNFNLDPRLLRHFAVFRLRGASGSDLRNVIFSVLEANMAEKPLSPELHDTLTSASSKLLERVKEALQPSPIPGRQHYAFSIRQLTKMCQCLKRLGEEERSKESYVVSFWKHEMQRLFKDQLCRSADVSWFDRTMESISKEHFANVPVNADENGKKDGESEPAYFTTFQVEAKVHHRPIASSHRSNRIKLFPLTELKDTYECLQANLQHFNEDQQHTQDMITGLMLSDDTLLHVIRMHRALSYYYGGSLTTIGAVGSHLSELTTLSLHLAGLKAFKVDASRPATFFDSLRTAVRIAGTEGTPVVVVLTTRELYDESFLDAINSLLVAGEYPHLFSNDEMEGLLQVLTPTLRRNHPNMMSDPMKFFVSRVKCNLHIMINLPPNHKLITDSLQAYPGIFSETQVLWIRDWPQEVLLQQAEFFINHVDVAKEVSQKTRDYLIMSIANIHSLTLRDCKQTPWSGDMNPTVSMTGTSLQTKKDKESIKVEKMEMPNLPYSKLILLDRIKFLHRDHKSNAASEVFIGPFTYRKFMQCLHTLYKRAGEKLRRETGRLQQAFDTLEETRKDARTMQKAIGVLKSQFNSAQAKVSDLFKKLTTEATRFEKLKAHLGIGTGPLNAFLQQLQLTEEYEFDDDFLLRNEERDEYDEQFEQMREANLKSKRVQLDEDIIDAKRVVDEARASLVSAKAQVEMWKSKVDRGCIERLKAFTNPPVLVAQVLEMVMVLVEARPWLIGSRSEQQSQIGPRVSEARTPKSRRRSEVHEGLESRVSSGSTLKNNPRKAKSQIPRQLTRKQRVSAGGKSEGTSAVDRSKWKSMQNFMNDTVRFVDMIHAVDWETGLEDSILTEVESYLKKGKEGQEGVTGEGSLLEHTSTVAGHPRKTNITGITISSARYSSEDAAVLVEYVISIVEYTRLCGPLKNAIDNLSKLEAELEDIKRAEQDDQKVKIDQQEKDPDSDLEDEEGNKIGSKETSIEGLTKDDVERIQSVVNDLQEKYDNAVVKKHRLKSELQTSRERLHSALATLESLKPLEIAWKKELDDSITTEQLLTNCILAAAFMTYCSGMTLDSRRRLIAYYTHVCKHYELPLPNKKIFDNYSLPEFILTPTEIQSICMKKLPIDNESLENACILTSDNSNATWCLICDPCAKIIDWIEGYFSPVGNKDSSDAVREEENKSHLVQVQYSELRSQFETSLSEGHTLLITYCDVEALAHDDRFHEVFRRKSSFLDGKAPFKMMVGDHEVECDPNFRLYLHTATLPQCVPPELSAYTTVVYNQTTRDGVKMELLDRFMRHEKPKLRDEWNTMQKEKLTNMVVRFQLQDQLKDILVGEHRLLNDLSLTRRLTDIKKNYDEATEMQAKLSNTEESIERAKEGFTDVAVRGAVMYDAVQSMAIINPLYYTSWQRFLSLYDENIEQSERSSLKVVCSQMTYNIYLTISQSLLEDDRQMFAILTALEVEDSFKNVNIGEREFLISPSYGGALMASLGYQPSESRAQAKKTFDWMSDDIYHNVQILGMYYDWFFDSFDRMPKDGREMQWRLLCEADAPEQASRFRLPDSADDHYTPLQRLLVIRAIRPDRIVQASTEFLNRVLGKRYVKDDALDMSSIFKQSSQYTPILLLFKNENQLAVEYLRDYAEKDGTCHLEVIQLVGEGATGEEKKTRHMLSHAMDNGEWLLLHNIQLNQELVKTVISLLSETNTSFMLSSHGSHRHVHENFRLILSSSARADAVPSPLLHVAIKLVVDHPKSMKNNLLRFFNTYVDSDMLSMSSRTEWLPCLHNVCLLHGAIRLRSKLPINVGWQDSHAFDDVNITHLKSAVDAVCKEFSDVLTGSSEPASSTITSQRSVSWSGLRYQIAELIYGNYVTNSIDQLGLNSLVDYWMSANSVKREFELPKVKYRLPAVMFSSNPKQASVIQSVESMSQHSLDSAEGCNLHHTPDAIIGDDQYTFTRLNKVYDALPESRTLSHKLYPRPPTAMSGSPQTAISTSSSHPWVIQRGVFASHTHALVKSRKEFELWEICYNALSKVPKGWSKDHVSERIKKIGGPTPFNLFLQKELEQLHRLLIEIKRSLTSVKNTVENLDRFGDCMPPEDIETADHLYRARIPPRWMKLAGESAPPDTSSLSFWLNDIASRVAHFERVLALGKDKLAAYWLGAFFNPHALLSVFKQEAMKNHLEKTGSVDNIVFHTEITQRDKDHLRDPPSEGFFLHGVYLWGCSWEKTTGEMQDTPPKSGPTALPVIHVTFTTESAKLGTGNELIRPVDYYGCPVFITTTCSRHPVFELDVIRESIPSSRWALRGLTATIRPF